MCIFNIFEMIISKMCAQSGAQKSQLTCQNVVNTTIHNVPDYLEQLE